MQAQLGFPEALAGAPGGGFYVEDRRSCVLRKVDASGTITTVAGNGTCGYTGDGGPATAAEISDMRTQGVAVEPDGSLLLAGYVDTSGSSTGRGVVRKVSPGGTITTVFGPTTNTLIGFAGSPDGTAYVVDVYPGHTTTITVLAPDGTSSVVYSGSPVLTTIAYDGPGQLAVGEYSPTEGAIARLDLATGTLTPTGFSTNLDTPGLATGSDGTIYVATPTTIVRIAPDNTTTSIAGGGTGDPLKGGSATSVNLSPVGLALTGDDGLLISTGYNGAAVYRLQLPAHSS